MLFKRGGWYQAVWDMSGENGVARPSLTLAAFSPIRTPATWFERLEWQRDGGRKRVDSFKDKLSYFNAYMSA